MFTVSLWRAESLLQKHLNWLQRFAVHDGRATTKVRYAYTSSQARHISKKSTRKLVRSREHRVHDKVIKHEELAQTAAQILRLVQSVQAPTECRIYEVEAAYNDLTNKSKLTSASVELVAGYLYRNVSQMLRWSRYDAQPPVQLDDALHFAKTIIHDIQHGVLQSDPKANTKLMLLLQDASKHDEAVQFFRWLETRQPRAVSGGVYGVALPLLARTGTPLQELEEIFTKALDELPGNFNSYHLSTNAILLDRTQPAKIHDHPIALLNGIAAARTYYGDSRNAYLALDTALRLVPDRLKPEFFTHFMELRPLSEAFTLFSIASRAGILVPAYQYASLLARSRDGMDYGDPARYMALIRAMVSITYQFLGNGGKLTSNAVNQIVIGTTQVLKLHGTSELHGEARTRLAEKVAAIVRRSLKALARYGAQPGVAAFNSIIKNIGSCEGMRATIQLSLADMETLELEPTEVTRRLVVFAAGANDDGNLVVTSWKQLVEARLASNQAPNTQDFETLINAARKSGKLEYAREQFDGMKDYVPPEDYERILSQLESREESMTSHSTSALNTDYLDAELSRLISDWDHFAQAMESGTRIHDYESLRIPMTLLYPGRGQLPELEMRKLYDEFTTESGKASALESDSISNTPTKDTARSITNISLDVLRYENWKSINLLLEMAENAINGRSTTVGNAPSGEPVASERGERLFLSEGEQIRSYGLADVLGDDTQVSQGVGTTAWSDAEIQQGREKIIRLRGGFRTEGAIVGGRDHV